MNRWIKKIQNAYTSRIVIAVLLALVMPISYITYQATTRAYQSRHGTLLTPPETVKGEIITLRKLKEEFYIDFHNAFSNIVRKNLEFPEFITLNYTIQYLRAEQRKTEEGKMLQYCIFDNKDNKLIGSIEIRDKNNSDPGQFGWWINEAYWGGGRAQEALKLINHIYFRLKPHEKNYIVHVRLWNQRSYQALKKGGFEDIGYFYEDGKATRHIMEMKRP